MGATYSAEDKPKCGGVKLFQARGLRVKAGAVWERNKKYAALRSVILYGGYAVSSEITGER